MDKRHFLWTWLCITIILAKKCYAVPKFEANPKTTFSENADWHRSYYNENKTQQYEQDTASTKDRLQRLGYTTGYGTFNGYPAGTGLSAYNPIKLDLGGVVLGTLVGIGAIIIIPKILHAFHGGYAGYGRSENENDLSSLTSMLNKIDDILGQNNIDSTSCMQRAVCSYVRSTEYNLKAGAPDQMDEFIHMLSETTFSENADWHRSYYNENKTQQYEQDTASTKDRLQRLGYTTGYGTFNGYPAGTGLSAYNPIKLDLGGVVLGTLVGIGAIIIIPKILHAFHGGYAGYGRSENENDLSSLTSMLNKIDDILGQNNIDSTSCMQRAVCSYVRSTEYNLKAGAPDQMDEFIHMLSENALVDYFLDGTAIKEALGHGKQVNGKPCEEVYVSCPLNSKTATNVLMKLMPKKSTTKPATPQK